MTGILERTHRIDTKKGSMVVDLACVAWATYSHLNGLVAVGSHENNGWISGCSPESFDHFHHAFAAWKEYERRLSEMVHGQVPWTKENLRPAGGEPSTGDPAAEVPG